ncbi:MAG: hypothetical protein J2P18_02500 [Nocardia sp.]|nr:hypothetical protein [Nocardia sp.]
MDPLPAEAADHLTRADGDGSGEADADAGRSGAEWVRLIYNEPHDDATAWFGARGWSGERIYLPEYISTLGGTPMSELTPMQSLINLVTVTR